MNSATPTIGQPAEAERLGRGGSRKPCQISAQPAQWQGGRTVILRVETDGRRLVYEIPLSEWSRLNRDAISIP